MPANSDESRLFRIYQRHLLSKLQLQWMWNIYISIPPPPKKKTHKADAPFAKFFSTCEVDGLLPFQGCGCSAHCGSGTMATLATYRGGSCGVATLTTRVATEGTEE